MKTLTLVAGWMVLALGACSSGSGEGAAGGAGGAAGTGATAAGSAGNAGNAGSAGTVAAAGSGGVSGSAGSAGVVGGAGESGSGGVSGSSGSAGGTSVNIPTDFVCAVPELLGDVVAQTAIAGQPPAPQGGILLDGTYELVTWEAYLPSTEYYETNYSKMALVVSEGGTRWDRSFVSATSMTGPLGTQKSASGLWHSSDGVTLDVAFACPEGLTATLGYSVQGDELTLIDETDVMHFRALP